MTKSSIAPNARPRFVSICTQHEYHGTGQVRGTYDKVFEASCISPCDTGLESAGTHHRLRLLLEGRATFERTYTSRQLWKLVVR